MPCSRGVPHGPRRPEVDPVKQEPASRCGPMVLTSAGQANLEGHIHVYSGVFRPHDHQYPQGVVRGQEQGTLAQLGSSVPIRSILLGYDAAHTSPHPQLWSVGRRWGELGRGWAGGGQRSRRVGFQMQDVYFGQAVGTLLAREGHPRRPSFLDSTKPRVTWSRCGPVLIL